MQESYDAVRASVLASSSSSGSGGKTERVEVNQRALIDKILARYATAGAVYRELLQNSNDAEASVAEIYFSCSSAVTQVVYRNNGHPFRPQDWDRLRKIAEGNPSPEKVGAFGVGAYTMFSLCEEPLVLSGSQALCFLWKGDSLWTTTTNHNNLKGEWTTFVLKSRDPYPLPNMVEFGQFLSASLTFTQCLRTVRVFINDECKLDISKVEVHPPTPISAPKDAATKGSSSVSSWLGFSKSSSGSISTPQGIFTLSSKISDESITETVVKMTVKVYNNGVGENGKQKEKASVQVRYVSGLAHAKVTAEMERRMERVTKKKPPTKVNVHIFLAASSSSSSTDSKNGTDSKKRGSSTAQEIVSSVVPQEGKGRIFIGFRTSQTTGLAAHVAAPLVPTVEREAIDFQDPSLKIYNMELLALAGILLRLTLEHAMMGSVAQKFAATTPQRLLDEQKYKTQKIMPTSLTNRKLSKEESSTLSQKDDASSDDDDSTIKSKSGKILGFAKFMAKGVKQTLVDAVKSVEAISTSMDEEAMLLDPPDRRPLDEVEREAILLMRSFCPQQTTPDARVGTVIAEGFTAAVPNHLSPPVLTKTGVVRGNDALLPNKGMEAFCESCVVRKLVLHNAPEYHSVIAAPNKLQVSHVVESIKTRVLGESEMIQLLKWWAKYSRSQQHSSIALGRSLKEVTKFHPDGDEGKEVRYAMQLRNFTYYVDKSTLSRFLPMPDSVLPYDIETKIGTRSFGDLCRQGWFKAISVDIWASFIFRHQCMMSGDKQHSEIRVLVLVALSQEYHRLKGTSGHDQYCQLIQNLLSDIPCIPTEKKQTQCADRPSNLYLHSADLDAFEGIGTFHKVSRALTTGGVSEDFLLMLGVRKAVAIEFLFSHLNTLDWNSNPRPLIAYLRAATLSQEDLELLKTTRYLPGHGDQTRTFAPSELYLPSKDATIFPFVNMLQWPNDNLSESSPDGKFLKKIGIRSTPPLHDVMNFIDKDVTSKRLRIQCLNFVCKRLGTGGVYSKDYGITSSYYKMAFLPCLRLDPIHANDPIHELHAPCNCFCDESSLIMGFPVLDPKLEATSGLSYSNHFQCASNPKPEELIKQLVQISSSSKSRLSALDGKELQHSSLDVLVLFDKIFQYLSTQSFGKGHLTKLKQIEFIPCKEKGDGILHITWHKPSEVYFNDRGTQDSDLSAMLFHGVAFSPFLASIGVQSELSIQDIFRLLLSSPSLVLEKLGSESKYRSLLRRIAADPPYKTLSDEIKQSPFLLAYSENSPLANGNKDTQSNKKMSCSLAKAQDICIVDNSLYSRMFPTTLTCPPYSELEEFYRTIGSTYISERVKRTFDVVGATQVETHMTRHVRAVLNERGPLLVSPLVTSRPLVANANILLADKRLNVIEVSEINAQFKLGNTVKSNSLTCCTKPNGKDRNTFYITNKLDWFDVGTAIGGLILKKCELEDALILSSLLEAPLDQLRARGFAVDRVLRIPDEDLEPVKILSNPKDKKEKDGISEQTVHEKIVAEMFPDCSEEYIRKQLGKNPDIERVRHVADALASGTYPRKTIANANPSEKQDSHQNTKVKPKENSDRHKSATSAPKKRMGHMPHIPIGIPLPGRRNKDKKGATEAPSMGGKMQIPKPNAQPKPNYDPVAPGTDALSQQRIESLLKQTVGKCRSVDKRGISSHERSAIPADLEKGTHNCDVMPAQDLQPFDRPYKSGKASNGIRVFLARRHTEISHAFLNQNIAAIDAFATVLQSLCEVYNLEIKTVAIFHDPCGNTIAFNANRSLHFNIRYFHSLHWASIGSPPDTACYAYWFTIMAHELAHNLVSSHNKEHGQFTENYVSLFLPKLVALLSKIARKRLDSWVSTS